jgi:ketosteroid isomerase-like protein
MTHPNADLVARGYDAFAQGDLETVMSLLADDIVWHVPGWNPLADDYRGKEEVMTFFAKLMEETGGTFRLSVHDIAATDRHALAIIDAHAERNGRSYDFNAIHVWHLRDGKAEVFRTVPIDAYADDAFWED